MDMQDPKMAQAPESMGHTLSEAPATAADAGIETNAAAGTVAPEPEAEVAAELLMTEGEENVAAEAAGERTLESLLADALALLEKDGGDFCTEDIRHIRQNLAMLHKSARTDDEASSQPDAAQSETIAALEKAIEDLRKKKADWTAEQEAIKAANLDRKNAIIDEIVALADDTDNVNRTFPRYRELQDEFNAVGEVPPTDETSVWKRFQEARERYSDNLKINKELRDYDFKKNLEDKEALLAEVAVLKDEEDVISAYRRLQELHNRWRQIGPVAKELRDEIWNRFREASAEVNKRYQAFFEARKAREAENEAAKVLLCTQVEEIDRDSLKTFIAWDTATRRIQGMQEEWRKLGFASRKVNRELFARFRAACDSFFAAKAEFYRNTREEINNNIARKHELVAKAEALKDRTDWRAATDEVLALQKEWRSIGSVPRKQSDELWKRFSAACNAFFDNKKQANSGVRQTEAANLRAKREIIGMLSALTSGETDKSTAVAELRKLQDRWKEIGHVPFKEKDKLYEAYRAAVDAVRDHFSIAESRARRERFEANVAKIEDDGNKLFRERERLLHALESRRTDLRTYENNLGFLSAKSKSGGSLLHDLERRIDRLKADIADLEEKIRIIDTRLA